MLRIQCTVGEREVFVAYSRQDCILVGQLIAVLRKSGVRVRWDRDVPGGVDYRETLAGWIKGADLVVAVLTEHGARSPWVGRELAFAHQSGRPRLPIRIGDHELPDGLMLELSTTQIKDFPANVDARTLADCVDERIAI